MKTHHNLNSSRHRTWRLVATLAGTSLMASWAACGSDEAIGKHKDDDTDEVSTTPDGRTDEGQEHVADGGTHDVPPPPPPQGDDGGTSPELPTDGLNLPDCSKGFLEGLNSCSVCCIVDGDVIDWCQDLECTACEQDGLVIEPGATADRSCNLCTCNRDGSITCTDRDCEVDCDETPDACTWRTDRIAYASFDRGDKHGLSTSPDWGTRVWTDAGDQELSEDQRKELLELLNAPALRDFVRTGGGSCPAIDNYWSQVRGDRPDVPQRGRMSMTLYPDGKYNEGVAYTRLLRPDCEVDALRPLSDFIDRYWP
jgi:hypothetical protein